MNPFKRFIYFNILTSILSIGYLSAKSTTSDSVFEQFISREGDRLMEGDDEFRFAGVNMPGLTVPYDYTMQLPERLVLPTVWEQENGFKVLRQMNARVVRLWNLPIRGPDDEWMDWAYVLGPGEFNEESFKTIDRVLAFANQYGIRIIFPFTAEAGDYLGGIGTYADWRDKERQEFFTDPQIKADYKATLSYVINRRNTVTGQLYREDKAILAWEFGNELRRAPLAWEAEMADYIKSIDSNHLVMAGNDSRIPDNPPANLDIVTCHYYGGDWVERCREDRDRSKGKRPFIIGEYGGSSDVQTIQLFFEEALANGTSGHLIWSMMQHHRFGGYYWHQIFTHDNLSSLHWPGSESGSAYNERETVESIRKMAFRMAGEKAVPIQIPDTPEFLPFSDLPFISWRGSVGATGYVIERSHSRDGPWVTVGENVSDASVAYRPLWNDSTAKIGEDYYYRIAALNESGISAPSSSAGPMRFHRQVLVDELADFETCRNHSDGLVLKNEKSGLYAEYLYRAGGEAGEMITYRVPGKANQIRFWAFHRGNPGQIFEPRLEIEMPEGKSRSIPLSIVEARTLRVLSKVTQLADETRTLVRYGADLSLEDTEVPYEFILTWTGPTDLDRVEIEYEPSE